MPQVVRCSIVPAPRSVAGCVMTPEGRVKARVKRVLDKFKPIYTFWPVPYGYGASTLDCLVCYRGAFIAIETKAPGGKPTDRQKMILAKMKASGAETFLIDGQNGELERLETYLGGVNNVEQRPPIYPSEWLE